LEAEMKKRERRRWLTDRSARHKQYIFCSCSWTYTVQGAFVVGRPSEELVRYKPLLGKLRKGKSIGCNCRHRSHGNPKYGAGICVHCDLRPAVVERIKGKRACRAWLRDLREGVAPEDLG
jgi:hypothetical protein